MLIISETNVSHILRAMTDQQLCQVIFTNLCALENIQKSGVDPKSGIWKHALEEYRLCRRELDRRPL